jgi:ATP-dependent DNA helicase DinG
MLRSKIPTAELLSSEVISKLESVVASAEAKVVLVSGRVNESGWISKIFGGYKLGAIDSSVVPKLLERFPNEANVVLIVPTQETDDLDDDQALEFARHLSNLGYATLAVDANLSRAWWLISPLGCSAAIPPDEEAEEESDAGRVASDDPTRTDTDPLSESEIDRIFGEGGLLQQHIANYEIRPQQLEMARKVTEAFTKETIAVVEAGTGVGKTFAYLIPAILYATRTRSKVVIATNKINLQHQLIDKDIPAIQKALGIKCNVVLMKGRGNFLSRRRLEFALSNRDLFSQDRYAELQEIAEWANTTSTGDRNDRGAPAIRDEIWEDVQSDGDDCRGTNCPHYGSCFFYRTRQQALQADIIIVNHHLVLYDAFLSLTGTEESEAFVLPPYDHIIFDEAHSLAETTTNCLSCSVGRGSIMRQLRRLYSPRAREKGALRALMHAIEKIDPNGKYAATTTLLDAIHKEADKLAETLEQKVKECMDEIGGLLQSHQSNIITFNTNEEASPQWELVSRSVKVLIQAAESFLQFMKSLLGTLNSYPESIREKLADSKTHIKGVYNKLVEQVEALQLFLKCDTSQYCRWVEKSEHTQYGPQVELKLAPLGVSGFLFKAFFHPETGKKTVVLTSATLTIGKQFDHVLRQWGLDPSAREETNSYRETILTMLDSPFDYRTNCLLALPKDIPEPRSSEFSTEAIEFCKDVLTLTRGKAFVLFTAWGTLREFYEKLKAPLEQLGMTPLRQTSDTNRVLLLDKFRKSRNPVLFGTASFWEGVDVQGEQLQCVIIMRLPFPQPEEPVLQARKQLLENCGLNSFLMLDVPTAITRFKQGFGRLIRSATDRGVVVVMDSRIVSKKYGQIFLDSLPPVTCVVDKRQKLLREIRDFLES